MHPLQVAAQFAAYVWFTGSNSNKQPSQDEALRFANQNWTHFTPCAHEGLGRLLLKIAGTPEKDRTDRRRSRSRREGPRRRLVAAG